MSYELVTMKRVVDLIDKGLVLSDLEEEELKDTLKIRVSSTMGVNELESAMKKLVDYLCLKYGILDAALKVYEFRKDAIALRLTGQNYDNLGLFSLGVGRLYELVGKIYVPNILAKIYVAISKIRMGKFDPERFLEDVFVDSVDVRTSLGLEDEESLEQESLFGDFRVSTKEEPSKISEVSRALSLRTNTLRDVRRTLYREYTQKDICEACAQMIDYLSTGEDKRYRVIIDLMFKYVVPDLTKKYAIGKKKNNEVEGQFTLQPVRPL